MGYLLRKVRKNRWIKPTTFDWLLDDDIQADVLSDLGTKSNELSVYIVDDEKSNFQRIIAALAAGAQKPANIDYAIFKMELIELAGISSTQSLGTLPDEGVNKWHLDLCQLSAKKVLKLAKLILDNAEIDRVLKKRVMGYVASHMEQGTLDQDKINWDQKYISEIDKYAP